MFVTPKKSLVVVRKIAVVLLSALLCLLAGVSFVYENAQSQSAKASSASYPPEVQSLLDTEFDSTGWSIDLEILDDGIVEEDKCVEWNQVDSNERKNVTYRVRYSKEPGSMSYPAGSVVIVLNKLPTSSYRSVHVNSIEPNISADCYDSDTKANAWSYREVAGFYVFTNNEPISAEENVSGSFVCEYVLGRNQYAPDSVHHLQLLNGMDFIACASLHSLVFSDQCSLRYTASKKNYSLSLSTRLASWSQKMDLDANIYVQYHLREDYGAGARPIMGDHLFKVDIPAGAVLYDMSMAPIRIDYNGYASLSNLGYTDSFHDEWGFIVGYPKAEYEDEKVDINVSLYGKYSPVTSSAYASDFEDAKEIQVEQISTASAVANLSEFTIASGGLHVNIEKGDSWSTGLKDGQEHTSLTHIKEIEGVSQWNVSVGATYVPTSGMLRVGDDRMMIQRENGGYEFLSDNEYHFVYLEFPFSLYNYAGGAYASGNISAAVYIRYANETQYTLYKEYSNFYNDRILLPEGTCGVRVDFKGVEDGIRYARSSDIAFQLKSAVHTSDAMESGRLYNFAYVAVYDENGNKVDSSSDDVYSPALKDMGLPELDVTEYGYNVLRDLSWVIVEDVQEKWNARGNGNFKQQQEKSSFDLQYSFSYAPYTSGEYIYPHNFTGGTFYAVLPPGLEPDSFNVNFDIGDSRWEKLAKTRSGKALTQGYINSHSQKIYRKAPAPSDSTVVEVILDFRDDPVNLAPLFIPYGINYSFSVFKYQINASLPYEAYQEHGTKWSVSSGLVPFDSINVVSYTDTKDSNLNENVREKIATSTSASVTISAAMSYQRDVVTHVSTDKTSFSAADHESSLGSPYSYKLRLRTSDSAMTDIVIYDSLETSSKGADSWRGTFSSVDTSYAISKSYIDSVDVYCSEKEDPGTLEDSPGDWSKYSDVSTDKSKVKSLAFKFLDVDGSPAIMPEKELVYVLVNMMSPASPVKGCAYNSFSTYWKEVDAATGIPSEEPLTMKSNTTRVYTERPIQHTVKMSVVNGQCGQMVDGTDSDYNITGDTSAGNGEVIVSDTETVTIVYRPRAGYRLVSVTVNGTPIDIESNPEQVTLERVESDYSVDIVYSALVDMPDTGSRNEALLLLAGIACVLAGTISAFATHRRRSRACE